MVADGGGTEATGDASGSGDQPMDDADDDMNELMQNRDFLRSVLSSLPGVNPEEALQNLEEMAEQQDQKSEKKGEVSSITWILSFTLWTIVCGSKVTCRTCSGGGHLGFNIKDTLTGAQ